MSNSLRSDSAIFMINTKSQSLSTFTNLFRLPPPGYTLPASNILHKLTHQPFEINCSLHHIATIPTKYPPYYISIIHFFPSKLSLSVFQRGRQGGVRGGTAAFATVSEFPLGFFSHLPNSGTPGSTRPCNCERVPPRIFFPFAKYKKVY